MPTIIKDMVITISYFTQDCSMRCEEFHMLPMYIAKALSRELESTHIIKNVREYSNETITYIMFYTREAMYLRSSCKL